MAAKKVVDAVESGPKSLAELFPGAAIRTGNLVFDVDGNILGEVEVEPEPEVELEPDDKDPEDDK